MQKGGGDPSNAESENFISTALLSNRSGFFQEHDSWNECTVSLFGIKLSRWTTKVKPPSWTFDTRINVQSISSSKIERLKIKIRVIWLYLAIAQCSHLANFHYCQRLIGGARMRIGKALRWTSTSPPLPPPKAGSINQPDSLRTPCPLQPTLTHTFLGSSQGDRGPLQPRLSK